MTALAEDPARPVAGVPDPATAALLDTLSDGVAVLDERGDYLFLNTAAKEMLGIDRRRGRADTTGQGVRAFRPDGRTPLPPDEWPSVRAQQGLACRDQIVMFTLPDRPAGRWLSISAEPVGTVFGQPGVVLVFRDVSERHQAEEIRQQTEERLRLLLDGAPDYALLMLDAHGRIGSWSASAERMTGWPEREMLGRDYAALFGPADRAAGEPRRILDAAARAGRLEVEGPRLRRDGDSFWAHGTLTAIRDADGTLSGYVKVTQDITERRAAQQTIECLNGELRRANGALESRIDELHALDVAKSDFVASVSHELRTPLTSIHGYTELLADGEAGPLAPAQQRAVAVIDRNSTRLLRLIDDLLTVFSIDRGTFELVMRPVDLSGTAIAVAEAVGPAITAAGLELRVTTPPGPATVTADAGQIERVLLNLVNNSVKFSPGGGTVTITVERHRDGGVDLVVADTGLGISPADQARLFQRFARGGTARDRAIGGTGLGLAISKDIVARHGGRIELRSSPGDGTVVTVSLPADPARPLPADPAPSRSGATPAATAGGPPGRPAPG